AAWVQVVPRARRTLGRGHTRPIVERYDFLSLPRSRRTWPDRSARHRSWSRRCRTRRFAHSLRTAPPANRTARPPWSAESKSRGPPQARADTRIVRPRTRGCRRTPPFHSPANSGEAAASLGTGRRLYCLVPVRPKVQFSIIDVPPKDSLIAIISVPV